MIESEDRFYFLRRRFATHHLRKKFPLFNRYGWKNATDYTIEFYFNDRDVFNEVVDTLSKQFPFKLKSKIHYGKDNKAMILFISSKKALKFLIKRYKLLIQ